MLNVYCGCDIIICTWGGRFGDNKMEYEFKTSSVAAPK